MKKYITLAALLAAGTTFANAETLIAFNTLSNVSANITESDYGLELSNLDLAISETNNFSTGSFKTDYLRPAVNVGNGGTWTLTFTITNNGLEVATLSSVNLSAFTFNSTGAYQDQDRKAQFTMEGTATSYTFNGTQGVDKAFAEITLDFADITLAAGASHEFSLKVDRGSETNGTFVGLQSVSFSGTGTVVPEPSAFGMLAGLGALALVAARRRRK